MSKTITLVKELTEEVKTPQVRAMLSILSEKVGLSNAVVAKDFFPVIEADPSFVSRQGAERVWKFYEKAMVENGFIEIAGIDAKPEKAAKAATTEDAPKEEPKRTASKRTKENHETAGEHGHAHETK
jgi:hypothetical protein